MLLRIIMTLIIFTAGIILGVIISRRANRKTEFINCKVIGGVKESFELRSDNYYLKLEKPDGTVLLHKVDWHVYKGYDINDTYTLKETTCKLDRTEVINDIKEILTD